MGFGSETIKMTSSQVWHLLLNLESIKPVGVLLQGTLFFSFSGELFFLNIFFENEVKFERFKDNISDFLIWFLVCSQKDRKMIKDLYVIFVL